jgi:hypothetical protein
VHGMSSNEGFFELQGKILKPWSKF